MTATTNDGFVQTTATGGETTIDFDFLIYAKTDMLVYETDTSNVITLLVLNTDYTIADGELNDPTGGTLALDSGQYPSGATAGHKFTCISDIAETRSSDFQQGGDFFASTLNTNLDRLTRVTQQLRRDVDKAARPKVDSLITSVTFTEDPADGYALVWSGTAGNIRNSTATLTQLETYGATLSNISSEIVAVAAIAANVTTVAGISAAVSTVAGIAAAVVAVASISSAVSAVAAIDTETAAVAAIAADIQTCAANISEISAVAAALAAAIASGITVDDSGFSVLTGTNSQDCFDEIDAIFDGGVLPEYIDQTVNAVGSISGATAIDLDDGRTVSVTLGANSTITFSNWLPSGQDDSVKLIVTTASTYTLSFGSITLEYDGGAAPDLPTAGNRIVLIIDTQDGGSNGILYVAGADVN